MKNLIEILINKDLTISDVRVLCMCVVNINYETGVIEFDNKFMTPKDFVNKRLSKSSVLRSIRNLIELGLLGKTKTGDEYILHANPFVFTEIEMNDTLHAMFQNFTTIS